MSIALMTAVWRLDIQTTDKMVLLALADAANDDGVTWMAVQSRNAAKLDLMKKSNLSLRAVQGAIKRLCALGYLSREDRTGKGVIWTVTPAANAPRQDMPPAPNARPPAPNAGKPSLNRQPSSEANASEESAKSSEFDDFWKLYPHKKAKGAARKAYLKARKAIDHGTLVRAVATQVGWGVWENPEYSPHAATWLNGERWSDEPNGSPREARKPSTDHHRPKPVSMAGILAERRRQAASADDVSGLGGIFQPGGGLQPGWIDGGKPEQCD